MVVAVSRLAHELADEIGALDLNPVVVTPGGAVAVDALVVPARLDVPDAPADQEDTAWTA